MIDFLFAVALAFIGLSLIAAAHAYLRLSSAMKREYGRAVTSFYDAATPLIEDDEVPDSLRGAVMTMSDYIDDPLMASALYVVFKRTRFSDLSRQMSAEAKASTEFFARRPELEKQFESALKHWMIAVTAIRPLYGAYVRVRIFSHFERMEKVSEITIRDQAKKRHDNDTTLDGGTAPAAC